MKAIVVPERSFAEAFRAAEYDLNKAIHDATDAATNPPAVEARALANAQQALAKLKDRLIETQI